MLEFFLLGGILFGLFIIYFIISDYFSKKSSRIQATELKIAISEYRKELETKSYIEFSGDNSGLKTYLDVEKVFNIVLIIVAIEILVILCMVTSSLLKYYELKTILYVVIPIFLLFVYSFRRVMHEYISANIINTITIMNNKLIVEKTTIEKQFEDLTVETFSFNEVSNKSRVIIKYNNDNYNRPPRVRGQIHINKETYYIELTKYNMTEFKNFMIFIRVLKEHIDLDNLTTKEIDKLINTTCK